MENEHSDLKNFSGAQNANPTKNQEDQEIVELKGRTQRQREKAKERAEKPERSQLPGVNLQ